MQFNINSIYINSLIITHVWYTVHKPSVWNNA